MITDSFHLSFRIGKVASSLLFVIPKVLVLGYSDSVDTYSRISPTSLPNSLLAVPRFAAGANRHLTWIIPHWGVYCGAMPTDALMRDRASTSPYTLGLPIQEMRHRDFQPPFSNLA